MLTSKIRIVFLCILIVLICIFIRCIQRFCVNLYKEYTFLKSRELEELPRLEVMTWQPFQLLRFALNCCFSNSYLCKCSKKNNESKGI